MNQLDRLITKFIMVLSFAAMSGNGSHARLDELETILEQYHQQLIRDTNLEKPDPGQ